MRKLSWLIAIFTLACAAGAASASCTLAVNTPVYSYQTLPGQTLKVTVSETGCPQATVTAASMAPSGSDSIVTYTGNFSGFTVGKFVQIDDNGLPYPFTIINAAALEILSANGTTLTAKYVGHNDTIGTTSVTATAIQPSKINWSEATTTGTQTASLSCTSGCIPMVKVTMGGVNGHCSLLNVTPFTLTCTQVVTMTATAVDGGSSITFPIYGAGVTTKVWIDGAYKQLYENQVGRLQSHVFGNANHNINWTHTGTCTVVGPSNKRDIYFSSSTSQHCTFTATSAADATKTDTRLIYIVPAAIPSYGSAVEHSEPVPCAVDATLTGTVYDVGPTQSFTTINAVPFNMWTGGGHIVRLHNEDTGSSPTHFPEYIQPGFDAAPASNPDYICGLANSLGYKPVMDGNGAHGPTYANGFNYGGGLVTTNTTTSCSGDYPSTCTPSHLAIAGIHFIHTTAAEVTSWSITSNVVTFTALAGSVLTYHAGDSVILTGFPTSTFFNNQVVTVLSAGLSTAQFEANFTHANGSATEAAYAGYVLYEADGVTPQSWGDGSAGINFHTGDHLEAYGNHCEIGSQCVASYENSDNRGFANITWAISEQRNYADGMGAGGSFLSHPFYMQSYGMELWGNLITAPAPQGAGSCKKVRGVGVDLVNNYCFAGFGRHTDWVEVQDSSKFTNLDNYVNNGAWPTDTADADVIIGYQEELLDDNVEIGNAANDPTFFGNNIHFMGDHDDVRTPPHMGMNSRYGILSSAYETYYSCGQMFDTVGSGTPIYWLAPEWVVSNSAMICPSGATALHMNSLVGAVITASTNMFYTGNIDNTLSLYGDHYNGGSNSGWTSDWAPGQYLMPAPIENHLNGNLTTDYLVASTIPFNTTTLVPGSSSPLVGQATGLAGEASLFTLAYNAVALDGSISPRTDLSTIGAYDPAGGPTVVSIAVTPNPASVVTSSTVNLTATATWSDSTTTNVTTLASWSNGGSSFFTVGVSTGVVTGVSAGSGTVSATYSSITGTATVNVSAPPPPTRNAFLGGRAKTGGSSKLQ